MQQDNETGMKHVPEGTLQDSSTFARCSSCRHAKDVNQNSGTLFCSRHDMFINAEADEIPDACLQYELREGDSPPDEGEAPADAGKPAEPS